MKVNTYLHFNGNCADALKFYEQVLDAKVVMSQTFGDSPAAEHSPPEMKSRIIHARIQIGDALVMASDTPPERYSPPAGVSMTVNVPSIEEAEKRFAALSEGGQVQMPLTESFFAHRFGMLVDKFGVPWMVICEKTP
ncbi:MAG: VOC family protein [Alphaproteobacteria bacterium]|nr:VOC family protein [Alphaproteobacteria bacterium]